MMPYMTTHSVISFDHDAIYDNDGILGLVPNLCISASPLNYFNLMVTSKLLNVGTIHKQSLMIGTTTENQNILSG